MTHFSCCARVNQHVPLFDLLISFLCLCCSILNSKDRRAWALVNQSEYYRDSATQVSNIFLLLQGFSEPAELLGMIFLSLLLPRKPSSTLIESCNA
ncbi:hypothetical protein SEVIR_3G342533v4 [Setaria viridis]